MIEAPRSRDERQGVPCAEVESRVRAYKPSRSPHLSPVTRCDHETTEFTVWVKCGDGTGTDLPARVFTKSSTGFDMREPLAGMHKRRAPTTLPSPIGDF